METTDESQSKRSVHNPGLSRQIIASLIGSIATCQAGMFGGWLSPMALKLLKDDSPVEKMTKDEIAFMGSLPSYAGILMAALVGYLAKTAGRRSPIIVAGVLSCISGIVTTFAPGKTYLYVGRIVGCIISGTIASVFMYTSETVHESIRGTMISLSTMLLNGGILISYLLGSVLSYKVFNAIFIVLPITYTVLLLFWLPESPYFLVEKSRLEEAKKSLLWFNGGDQQLAESELGRIVAAANAEHDKIGFWQVLKNKSTRLPLIIAPLGFVFQTLSGVQAILNYAGLIFEEAGSLLSPETCSIITGAILTVSCGLNLLLIDRLGRKPLLYVSFIGGAIILAVLSSFLYIKMKGTNVDGFGWIPVGSLGAFMVVYGLGVATVPGAISNEISPTSIRPLVNATIIVLVLPTMSAVIQTFPFLDDNLGLYSVFAIPVCFNVLATLFTYFMVPETKGKYFAEIEDELKNW